LFVNPIVEKKHLGDLIKLDNLYYCSNPSDNFLDLFYKKPWMWTVLERINSDNTRKVLGYGCIMPLTSFAENALKQGDMFEDELNSKHILLPDEASSFYVSSIAINPDSNSYETARLTGYVLGQILKANKPSFGIAVSKAGLRIGEEIGMNTDSIFRYSTFKAINMENPVLLQKNAFDFRIFDKD